MGPRTSWLWLAACLVLGGALRLAYLAEIRRAPDFAAPTVDAGYHDYWARGLALGQWRLPPSAEDPRIQATPYFRPPGYPYFLALTYFIGRGSYLAPRLAQMLLGLLSIVLAWQLALRWFGRGTAALTALFMAVYWNFIFFEGELLESPLLLPLALSAVLLAGLWAEDGDLRKAFGCGGAVGIFALVRPNILLFLPLLLFWMWRVTNKRFAGKIIRRSMLAAVLATSLAIAPATVRNWRVGHDPVLISSNSGINLFLGNNPSADGRIMGFVPGFGTFLTCFDYPAIVRQVGRVVGKPLPYSQVSSFFSRKAIDYMAAHPARTAALLWRKILLFWGPLEVGHNKEEEIQRSHSPLLGSLPGSFPLFAGLAAATLVFFIFAGLVRGPTALCLLFVGSYFLSFLPYTVAGRYRTPVVPFLMVLSAAGIDLCRQLLRERRFHQAAAWLALSGVLVTAAQVNASGYMPDHPRWHYDVGLAWGRLGRPEQAVLELAEAVRLDPNYAEAHAALGYGLAQTGREDEAQREWQRSIVANPDYPLAYAYWGRYLLSVHRPAQALPLLRTAVRLSPDQESWRRDLSQALAAAQEEALRHE